MIKNITALALVAALASTSIITTADAGPTRGRHFDNHNKHHSYNGAHRGRGHYRNGKWIALGVLGAAAAAAIANSDDDGCYSRRGRRYCD